jgi:hypothetical protein
VVETIISVHGGPGGEYVPGAAAIKLVSVEAGVEPSLLRTSIAYSRISLAEWLAGAASDADVLVWNNNLVMPAGAPGRTPNAKLVVNWGTGDVNIEQPGEWTDARLVTTVGYCTNTVRDFVLSCIGANTELKYDAAVGLVGIGRIGYSVAAALEPIVGSKGVLYTSRRPRPGLRFTPVALDELMERADAIVVALNSHEPLDLKGLTKNRRYPLLLTISPEPVLPVSQIAPLVDSGIVSAMVATILSHLTDPTWLGSIRVRLLIAQSGRSFTNIGSSIKSC